MAEVKAKPTPFRVRGPLLRQGAVDTPIFATDLLWAHLKIYADGGENDLHSHPYEEHAFVVLDGEASFFDADGNKTVVKRYEGMLLPMGARYRFQNSGEGNLVMLRIGVGSNSHVPGKGEERRGPDGQPLTFNPSQVAAGRTELIELGSYFGAD